jgi:hypothetical protein
MTLAKLACLSPQRLVPQEVEGDCLCAVPKLAAYGSMPCTPSLQPTLCIYPANHLSCATQQCAVMAC